MNPAVTLWIAALPLFANIGAPASESRLIESEAAKEWLSAQQSEAPESGEELLSRSHYALPVYLPLTYTSVTSIAYDGSSFELRDGSVWKVPAGNGRQWLAQSFDATDALYLTPNRSLFAETKYRLVNETKGWSMPVQISMAPLLENPYTYQILGLDPMSGLITLGNRQLSFLWKIDPRDYPMAYEYRLGDTVVLGCTSGWHNWMSRPYEDILINIAIEGHPYIRAQQL